MWLGVIAVPALLLFARSTGVAKERLFLATALVNSLLATAVVVRWCEPMRAVEQRIRVATSPDRALTSRNLPRWFWMALAVSVTMFAFHAALMPHIPLVEMFVRPGITANELTEAREAASKFLPLPLSLKYALYWNVRVLVPVLMIVLILQSTRPAQLVILPLLIVLSSMTLEKSLPTFVIASVGFGLGAYRRLAILSRPVLLSLFIALAVASGLQTGVKYRDFQARSASSEVESGAVPGSQSPVGQELDWDRNGAISWHEVAMYPIRFIYHRILTGPADVAYAWFEYFPEISRGFLGGRTWSLAARSDPEFRHPANLVGVYAYHRRDPAHYLESAYAYAAFHADAWANFGYGGVAIASVLTMLTLLLTDLAVGTAASPVSAGAAGAAMSILLTTLPAGGLQAALVAQGLAVALGLALAPAWLRLVPKRFRLHDAPGGGA